MVRRGRDKRVQTYLRVAANIFGLKDWEIILETESPSVDPHYEFTYAESRWMEGNHGYFRFSEKFYEIDPTLQRLTVAHEMAHGHLSQLSILCEALDTVLDKKTYALFERLTENAEEQAVEAFARLLADRLPLPRFGK